MAELGSWHKSSYSGAESNCVEIAWRKSSYSGSEANCVELGSVGAVRDSKNPHGALLRVDLGVLVAAVKAGHFDC
jgi:hypothetical protein